MWEGEAGMQSHAPLGQGGGLEEERCLWKGGDAVQKAVGQKNDDTMA